MPPMVTKKRSGENAVPAGRGPIDAGHIVGDCLAQIRNAGLRGVEGFAAVERGLRRFADKGRRRKVALADPTRGTPLPAAAVIERLGDSARRDLAHGPGGFLRASCVLGTGERHGSASCGSQQPEARGPAAPGREGFRMAKTVEARDRASCRLSWRNRTFEPRPRASPESTCSCRSNSARIFETRGRLIARQPAQHHRLDHALAKIVGNSHPRRLPLAARMRKPETSRFEHPLTNSIRCGPALIGRSGARNGATARHDEPIAATSLDSQHATRPRNIITWRDLLRAIPPVNHRNATPDILDAKIAEQGPRAVGPGDLVRGRRLRSRHERRLLRCDRRKKRCGRTCGRPRRSLLQPVEPRREVSEFRARRSRDGGGLLQLVEPGRDVNKLGRRRSRDASFLLQRVQPRGKRGVLVDALAELVHTRSVIVFDLVEPDRHLRQRCA